MPKVSKKKIQLTWIISGVIALIFFTLNLIAYASSRDADDSIVPGLGLQDAYILTIIIFLFPPTIIQTIDARWRSKIDENLPNLLRDVSDAQKTGLTLPKAISESSKRNYGPLTDELKKMSSKISWGVPFDKAMIAFAESCDTSLVKRAALLILEAEKSGGLIEDIFDASYEHVNKILDLRRERLGQMKPYTWIIYAAYFVFLIVAIVLLQTFFQELGGATTGEGGLIRNVDADKYEWAFLDMLMIEAIFAGLVAGKMGEGSLVRGLKHSVILITTGWILFRILMGIELVG